jgi:hypothetical protein
MKTISVPDVNFRFHEDEYFERVLKYIGGTYAQHYGHEVDGKNVQVVDLWEGMGSLLTTSRDTAMKYLVRYGRKNGYNEKDCLKAIHYILLMMYAARNMKQEGHPESEKPIIPIFSRRIPTDKRQFSDNYTG